MAVPRVVLDTNVWLDWLVFDDPGVAALRAAHAGGRIEIVIDEACEAELTRVLAYHLGAHSLDAAAQANCIARCRGIATRVASAGGGELPTCRDADDQKFLALASAAGASFLISKDRALLELAPRLPAVRVVTPPGFGLSP
jgi:putative PIN family toxin of toxin-antitoxin system